GASASQYECNGAGISSGLLLHFRPSNCGELTQTSTPTATATPINTPTGTRTATITPGGPTLTPTSTNTPTDTLTPILTSTPTSTPPACGPASDYVVATATGTIVPGTTLVPGSQADDAVVSIPLPFTYYFYGVPFTS